MKIYLSDGIHPEAVKWLKSVAAVVDNFDEIEELDGIIIRRGGISREIIEKATKLKAIGRHGVGYDTVDVAAAKEHNVRVLNVPHGNSNSVAELIVALFLEMSRDLYKANVMLRRGEITNIAPAELQGHELTNSTVGLVGVGGIAQLVAKMVKSAFNAEVIGYSRHFTPEKAEELGIRRADTLEELLEASDFVSISVPYNESTKDMISGEVFEHFKKNAVVVNTSRGGIVNEEELYNALVSGKLKGAALDVFQHEPVSADNKLLTLDNFSATPHIGGTTEEAIKRTSMLICQNVVKAINGEAAEGIVV